MEIKNLIYLTVYVLYIKDTNKSKDIFIVHFLIRIKKVELSDIKKFELSGIKKLLINIFLSLSNCF